MDADDVEAGVTQALERSRQNPGSTQARQFYAALQDAVRQFQSATAAIGIVVCSTTIVVVHRNVYVLDVPDRTIRRAGTTDAPRRPDRLMIGVYKEKNFHFYGDFDSLTHVKTAELSSAPCQETV